MCHVVSILIFTACFWLTACQSVRKFPLSQLDAPMPSSEFMQNALQSPEPTPLVFIKKFDEKSTKDWNFYFKAELESELAFLKQQNKKTVKEKLDLKIKYFKLGKRALAAKQGVIAVVSFKECLHFDLKDIECHWELGWSYFLTLDFQKALTELEWVKKIQPKRKGIGVLIKKIALQFQYQELALKMRKESPRTYLSRRKPSAKAESTLKIKAVGDTMLGSSYPENSLPPADLSILNLIAPHLVGSDLLFMNYEGTLCEARESIKCSEESEGSTCFAFSTPPRYASYLKQVNVNLVSLANNHIMDFGDDCRLETEKALEEEQIYWSGRKGSLARMDMNKIPYSFIAYHSAAHTNSTLDWPEVEIQIKAEKAAGRIVIVSFHGGAEGIKSMHVPNPPDNEFYFGENRGNVFGFAHTAIDAGADLVLGSGPHVVRGMELYKERLIAYSLGNFATYKLFNLWGFNAIGLILEVELDADGRFHQGRIIPTRQMYLGVPVFDDQHVATDLIRMLSKQDFPSSELDIAKDGTIGLRKNRKRSIAGEYDENESGREMAD
jgi:poly-gamma-glutamate capsule biosynthesis protein CapA/YwtB (metallophosphatase superfamily)